MNFWLIQFNQIRLSGNKFFFFARIILFTRIKRLERTFSLQKYRQNVLFKGKIFFFSELQLVNRWPCSLNIFFSTKNSILKE